MGEGAEDMQSYHTMKTFSALHRRPMLTLHTVLLLQGFHQLHCQLFCALFELPLCFFDV